MLIFKLEFQATDKVTRIFKALQALIPLDIYKSLFQIILTDNNHELFDVSNIECIHSTGKYVPHLFLGNSQASSQKSFIEKNHEFIRYILPKGPLSKILLKKTVI